MPVKVFWQKPGDFVLLGPGCLHWVRSEGIIYYIKAWLLTQRGIFVIKQTFNLNKCMLDIY